MASALPKIRWYIFLSIISIFINIGYKLSLFAYNNTVDISSILISIGTSFIPFTSVFNIDTTIISMPVEFNLLMGVFVMIISGIQTYLLVIIAYQFIPTANV